MSNIDLKHLAHIQAVLDALSETIEGKDAVRVLAHNIVALEDAIVAIRLGCHMRLTMSAIKRMTREIMLDEQPPSGLPS